MFLQHGGVDKIAVAAKGNANVLFISASFIYTVQLGTVCAGRCEKAMLGEVLSYHIFIPL